jgi:hypothetical protein
MPRSSGTSETAYDLPFQAPAVYGRPEEGVNAAIAC